jgi:hypothetical protein
VREAVEKQKQMDTELNLFFREVADIDAREEEREDEKVLTFFAKSLKYSLKTKFNFLGRDFRCRP